MHKPHAEEIIGTGLCFLLHFSDALTEQVSPLFHCSSLQRGSFPLGRVPSPTPSLLETVTLQTHLPRLQLRGDGGIPWPPSTRVIAQTGEGKGLQHDGLISKRQEKSQVRVL